MLRVESCRDRCAVFAVTRAGFCDRHCKASTVHVIQFNVENFQSATVSHPFDLFQGVILEVLVADRVVGVHASIAGM